MVKTKAMKKKEAKMKKAEVVEQLKAERLKMVCGAEKIRDIRGKGKGVVHVCAIGDKTNNKTKNTIDSAAEESACPPEWGMEFWVG